MIPRPAIDPATGYVRLVVASLAVLPLTACNGVLLDSNGAIVIPG